MITKPSGETKNLVILKTASGFSCRNLNRDCWLKNTFHAWGIYRQFKVVMETFVNCTQTLRFPEANTPLKSNIGTKKNQPSWTLTNHLPSTSMTLGSMFIFQVFFGNSFDSPLRPPQHQLLRRYGRYGNKQTNLWRLPSRGLTYPTLGKGKSSSKCHFWGIC